MARGRVVAGIDVGSSKVATVVAKVAEGEEPSVVGVASLVSKGVRKGQIVNIEEATRSVVESVEAAERMAGLNVSSVMVSINGAHIGSQNSTGVVAVADPRGEITQEDIYRVVEAAQAVTMPSGKQIIHVLPTSFKVDSQAGVKDPVGMTGIRLEVETHIVDGSQTAVKNLKKCVEEIGVGVDELVFSAWASAFSVLSETEKELGVVLVDIGGGTTGVAMFVEGSLAYSSVIPVGAKNITNDLAIGLRVSLETAEKIKLALSREASKEKRVTDSLRKKKNEKLDVASLGVKEAVREVSKKTLVDGIIRPRLDEIFTMVGLEIKKSNLAHLVPSGLVACGGGALSYGLVESARRILSVPVRVGYPTGVTGLIDDVKTPEFAGVVGLVLYGARAEGRGTGLSGITGSLSRAQLGGVVGKVIEVVKSLLP